MQTRADLIMQAHSKLDEWLEARKQLHGGFCTPKEWSDFLTMQRRTVCWNRKILVLYCELLKTLAPSDTVLRDRPQVYNFKAVKCELQ